MNKEKLKSFLRKNWEKIVLTLTFIVIAWNTFLTNKSINLQREFNIATIRPWPSITSLL